MQRDPAVPPEGFAVVERLAAVGGQHPVPLGGEDAGEDDVAAA